MPTRAETLAEAARLRALFQAAGGLPIEAPILQSAETLLDLYGEDIRARAYVTSDALRGEQMLRPDFTVPVVQMHLERGTEPARYTYAGEVFRRQDEHPDRASEYVQVGYEVFDRSNPAASDAEVFATIAGVLSDLQLRAATGDIGILTAAVRGLATTDRRKAALMRHVWRPRRFRALLDRFSGRTAVPPTRAALLSSEDPMGVDAPGIGKRSEAEVADRIAALREDAATPAISTTEITALETLLSVRETAPFALAHLRDIAVDLPSITPSLYVLEARLGALAARGIDVDNLDYEASYGRTSMEYYDGFVFGFYAEHRPDLPPIATGGRYDALARQMGKGAEVPAVGGVLRPDLMLELAEGGP